ncbi:MAG: hypothetical protein ACJA1E_000027 [Paracoccaceae bacterium]|jgi:hypothetical protein
MIIEMTLPKTFNNWLGFERGFWQRQSGRGAHIPETRVFERFQIVFACHELVY